MKIEILEFVDGAKQAKGLTVIIDVFRAFSVECYAYYTGAARVIATGETDEALKLRKEYRNAVLAGERHEKKVPGFDLGNSPTEVLQSNLTGKTMVHSTTAGTNGLVSAAGADILLAASLVNASATARYIRSINPGLLSLVAMGYGGKESALEDLLCAGYIKSLLTGSGKSFEKEISDLKNSSGKRFFNPANLGFSPPTDFFLCTMTDRFGFVLRAERRPDGNINIERIDV